MKRYTVIAIVFILLFFTPVVSAEGTIEAWGFQCVPFVHCSDGTGNSPSERARNQHCQPVGDNVVHTSDYWPHRSQQLLDQLTFPAGSRVIVTECIDAGVDLNGDGSNDSVCTTGDSTQDKILFCGDANNVDPSCDHFSLLKNTIGYNFDHTATAGVFHKVDGIFQKANGMILVDENGKTSATAVEWEAHKDTDHNPYRKYIAWYYSDQSASPTPFDGASMNRSSSIGGQQQATLTFPGVIPIPTLTPPENDACGRGVAWDPYGRVFDMKSLEPIPLTQILLNQKNPQGVFDPEYAKERNLMIFNPFTTGVKGSFVFFVEDGDYSIIPAKEDYTHPTTASESQLLPNTRSIYSDIYFSDSPPILQRGAIQHRDIPLMPTDGIGKKYDLIVIVENDEVLPDGRLQYSGVVSHPFTELLIETCTNTDGTEVCTSPVVYNQKNGGPDKEGTFEIILDQRILESGEYYSRSFRKIDIATGLLGKQHILRQLIAPILQTFVPAVVSAEEIQTRRVSLQPVPMYLEGFAYDQTGKIMPNAEVSLYIALSQRPVNKIKADAHGFFRLTSEYLPNGTYEVGYSTPDEPIPKAVLTTSQFLFENKEFIEAEKIDVYRKVIAQENPRRTVTPVFVPPQQISAPFSEQPLIQQPTQAVTQAQIQPTIESERNPFLLVGAILLLLIAAAATLIGVYMYKKKSKETTV